MNAKDKATAIVKQFWMVIPFHKPLAIKLAVIHVKGIIEQFESIGFRTSIGAVISYEGGQLIDKIQYWRDVLTELNQT